LNPTPARHQKHPKGTNLETENIHIKNEALHGARLQHGKAPQKKRERQ
jgi:hypothetical protein